MKTQPTDKPVSTGNCTFCNTEIAKNKMAQHLKFCKQRRATIATQEKKSHATKTRLFHIMAEGQDNPQYWLHFEMAASEPLWALDGFLKDMWIDDSDHSSGFTINGSDYSDDDSDEFFLVRDSEHSEKAELSKEEKEEKTRKLVDDIILVFTTKSIPYLSKVFESAQLSAEWIAEIKKPRSANELVMFLREEQDRITKGTKITSRNYLDRILEETSDEYNNLLYQKLLVEQLLESIEDRSMDASLGYALKVGQKFSYVYDYGSSTHIALKVIAEREGVVPNKKKPVQLLARNNAYEFACTICGKPATIVELDGFIESIVNSVYCAECAPEYMNEEMMLPIINSPRVGVL